MRRVRRKEERMVFGVFRAAFAQGEHARAPVCEEFSDDGEATGAFLERGACRSALLTTERGTERGMDRESQARGGGSGKTLIHDAERGGVACARPAFDPLSAAVV